MVSSSLLCNASAGLTLLRGLELLLLIETTADQAIKEALHIDWEKKGLNVGLDCWLPRLFALPLNLCELFSRVTEVV